MLGKNGFYSAVEFDKTNPQMTLAEASQAKTKSIFNLLQQAGATINSDTKFADLGCGWGAALLGALEHGIAR